MWFNFLQSRWVTGKKELITDGLTYIHAQWPYKYLWPSLIMSKAGL